MTSPPSSNSWNGRFIGDNQRYRVDRPLAAGGMGEVFLATDTRVGQQVVVKLLKDTLVASQEMRKRFEREVAVCAALQSDHIVKISDCGVTPEGYPFYVMEYLRGQTLRQLLLREKRLSVERTVKIISQVCKGLQLAHQGVTLQKDGGQSTEHIQVIHRDLKPDNIFLVPTDLGEWVKILDFGVAKIRNESSEQTNITNTFIGTFRYAAPEQIQNKRNLDARADIYSLGIILYEMLSAADPFGFNVKGSNISEASWILAHAYEPPTPLREQPGCENLSEEVEAVVLKCLHKNPANRFTTVEELNQALQAASQPVTPSVGTTYEPANFPVQPVPSPVVNQETIGRPVQPVEPHPSDEDTILRVRPLPQPGLNDPTVPRPVPGFTDETVPRPVPGFTDETVPRSVQPLELNQPEYHQGFNNETLPPPIHPVESEDDGTMFQPRPGDYAVNNNDTIPRPQHPAVPQDEGTMFQPRPGDYNDTVERSPHPAVPQDEGTMFQPRPGDYNDTVERSPHPAVPQDEGTMFQPRPGDYNDTVERSPSPPVPEDDGTMFQPRPGDYAASNNAVPDEGTMFQPRPVPRPGTNQNPVPIGQVNNPRTSEPDNTLYQPRPTPQPTNPKQDATIFQPKPQRNSSNLQRNILVGLAVILAFFLGMYIYSYLQSGKNSNNQNTAPNTGQPQ